MPTPTMRVHQPELAPGLLAVLRAMLAQQRAFRVEQLRQLEAPHPRGLLASRDRQILESLRVGAHSALDDVEAALARMDAGTYGRCVACRQPVGLARLEVLPQTALCMRCRRAGRPARRE